MIFMADIVDHGGEVVQRAAVGAQDDRIADQVGLPLDLAADQVVDDDGAPARHLEPQRRRLLLVEPHGTRRRRVAMRAAVDVVAFLAFSACLALGVELLLASGTRDRHGPLSSSFRAASR